MAESIINHLITIEKKSLKLKNFGHFGGNRRTQTIMNNGHDVVFHWLTVPFVHFIEKCWEIFEHKFWANKFSKYSETFPTMANISSNYVTFGSIIKITNQNLKKISLKL